MREETVLDMSLNPPLSGVEINPTAMHIASYSICVTGLQVPRKLASVTFLSGTGAWHAVGVTLSE